MFLILSVVYALGWGNLKKTLSPAVVNLQKVLVQCSKCPSVRGHRIQQRTISNGKKLVAIGPGGGTQVFLPTGMMILVIFRPIH